MFSQGWKQRAESMWAACFVSSSHILIFSKSKKKFLMNLHLKGIIIRNQYFPSSCAILLSSQTPNRRTNWKILKINFKDEWPEVSLCFFLPNQSYISNKLYGLADADADVDVSELLPKLEAAQSHQHNALS